jgi:hypothetical protein
VADIVVLSWYWLVPGIVTPPTGQMSSDGTDLATATTLYLSAESSNGDASVLLAALQSGDTMRVQPVNTPGQLRDFTLTGPAVPVGTFDVVWHIPVTPLAQGPDPFTNYTLTTVIFSIGANVPDDGAAWATISQAHEAWRESDVIPDARLTELLQIATDLLHPYARASDLDALGMPTPEAAHRLREATIMQAKDSWSVMTSDSGDVIGFETYALRRRPLSDAVKALLRPQTVPMVG